MQGFTLAQTYGIIAPAALILLKIARRGLDGFALPISPEAT
jgi:hypothetical protein